MSEREQGKVKWFNNTKGYGFIERENAEDIFVHYTGIQQEGYRSLREGQTVEFSIGQGPKGMQAEDVIVIKQREPGPRKAKEAQADAPEAASEAPEAAPAAEGEPIA